MTAKRKGKTRLPRMMVLVHSAAELRRLSDRNETLSAAVLALTDLVEQLREQVERLTAQPSPRKRPAKERRPYPSASMPGGAVPFVPGGEVPS